jgi:ferredoxin
MTAHRLHIDWTECDGRGVCVELLPEVLERDEWGYPLARARTAEPEVPAALARHAERAVKQCPRLALRLTGR